MASLLNPLSNVTSELESLSNMAFGLKRYTLTVQNPEVISEIVMNDHHAHQATTSTAFW